MENWIDDHSTFTFWVLYIILAGTAATFSTVLFVGAWSWIFGISICWIIWYLLEEVFCLTPWGD